MIVGELYQLDHSRDVVIGDFKLVLEYSYLCHVDACVAGGDAPDWNDWRGLLQPTALLGFARHVVDDDLIDLRCQPRHVPLASLLPDWTFPCPLMIHDHAIDVDAIRVADH